MSFTVIWTQILVVQPVDAAIAQRGTVTSANSATSNVTSLTVNKPTGVISGDVMIATIAVSGTPALTVPGGWISIESTNPTTSSTIEMGTWYKVAGTSEGASYQWSWTGTQRAAGTIVAFSGVDNSTPIDNSGTAHSAAAGNSAVPSAPTIPTTTANAMLVASFADVSNAANITAATSTPGTFAELTETASNSATTPNVATSVDTLTWASTGNTGAVSATGTSGRWVARVIALKPAGNPTLNETNYRWSVNADNTDPSYKVDNLSANDDALSGTAIDPINSVFYTVGDNSTNWVIEKHKTADGALCTSTNCGTTFGTAGRVTEDVASSATEKAYGVAVDPNGGYIYVVGMDNVTGGGQWRIEKRLTTDGSLVSGFGTGGVVQSNTSSSPDEATTALLDLVNGYVFVGGYDGTAQNQWSLQKYKTSNGLICTAANCGTQFGTNGIYIFDGTHGDDRISSLEIDPTDTYVYVSGYTTQANNKTAWTVQKMLASSAALCTAGNCGTQFGTSGTYTSDPSTRDDKVLTMQVDDAAGAMYLAGSESQGTGATQVRIEKISLSTAALDGTFGNNASCSTNNTGAICATYTAGLDKVKDMSLDGAGGYLYDLVQTDEGGTDSQWRVEKRQRTTGLLVTAWASSGVATLNPSSRIDPATSIMLDVDRSLLWVAGGDRTLSTSNEQWYLAPLNTESGTYWLAAQDTAGVSSTNVTFRLRLLLRVSTQQMLTNGQNLRLEYAPQVGTCDTAFVGETGNFKSIATSGTDEILYHDDPSVTDKVAMVTPVAGPGGGDPVDGSNTTVMQSIVESNDFTNNIADVGPSMDGEWDFVLNDQLAFGPYCFRATYTGGTVLGTYTQVPEITFCKNAPKADNLLRHGAYFCGGIEKAYFWTS